MARLFVTDFFTATFPVDVAFLFFGIYGPDTKCIYTIVADFYFIKKAFRVVDIVPRSNQMASTITASHTTSRIFVLFKALEAFERIEIWRENRTLDARLF